MKKALLAWMIGTVFLLGASVPSVMPNIFREYRIASNYQTVAGEITEAFPAMHSTCRYRFTVDLKEYLSTGRSCGQSAQGQKISVYYQSQNPNESMNLPPWEVFKNDLISLLLAVVLLPLVAAFVVWKRG